MRTSVRGYIDIICVCALAALLNLACSKKDMGGFEWDGIGPHIYMDFEQSREPLEDLPNRMANDLDSTNGCLPGVRWNEYYVYNVCVASTTELSDFSIQRTDLYSRSGNYSCRFMLRATPLDKWPRGEATHRAELSPNYRKPINAHPTEGEERWYGLSLLFPTDFVFIEDTTASDLRFSVAEWQHGTAGSPIVSIEVIGNKLVLARSAGESTNSVWIKPIEIAPIIPEKWIDLVVQIKWSKKSGEIEVWVDGLSTIELQGTQTIYSDLEVGGGYKFGINHWIWRDKDNVIKAMAAGTTEREVYIDEVREYLGSEGFDEVKPGF